MAPHRQLASGALRQVSRKRLAQVIAVQTTKPRGRGRPRKEAAVVNPEPVNHVEIEPNAADLAVNREVGVVSEEASVAPAHQQEATVRADSILPPAHVTPPTANTVTETQNEAPAHQQEAAARTSSTVHPVSVTLPAEVVATLTSNLMQTVQPRRTEGDILGEYVAHRFAHGTEREKRIWRMEILKLVLDLA
ncbi:hypothetical protein QR680_007611 [Steinernema hermaphroditum]|uniref:Uncharacterized protein n=1 Tax=Steinernema hermaphroditum TaxID=289476 RepID=A0AA39IG55_9BILA|nr:hypothetical protein QR680_007611 [Steinernema hermaphroditum]